MKHSRPFHCPVTYSSDLWVINEETGMVLREAIVMETRMLEALRAGKADTVVLIEGGQMCPAM